MDKQLFSGKYELEGEIARGGMGVIYKATHTTLNRTVAIKVLHPQYSGDSAFVKRFLREARAMARLDHQNIIRVFDVAESQGSYYIVMEFFQGQDLRQRIIEKEKFSYREVLLIALQVADALSYAHEHGIIHRDIKPGNIMIDKNEKVKIADFGIAAATDEVSVTATGQIMGTPEYMSPEQAQGMDLDGRCDLYSLGMIIYEMLTGKTAFERISRMSIIGKLLYDREEYVLSFPDDIPLPVQELVRCLLKKRPQDRIPDANNLMAQINRLLEGEAENSILEETLSREDQMPASLQEAEDDPTVNLSSTPSPAPRPEQSEAIGKPATRSSSRPRTEKSAHPLSQPPKLPEVKTRKSGGWIPLVAGLAGAVILAAGAIYYMSPPEEKIAKEIPVPPTPEVQKEKTTEQGAEDLSVLNQIKETQTTIKEIQVRVAHSRSGADEFDARHRAAEAYQLAVDQENKGSMTLQEGENLTNQRQYLQAAASLQEAQTLLAKANDGFAQAQEAAQKQIDLENRTRAKQERAARASAKTAREKAAEKSTKTAMIIPKGTEPKKPVTPPSKAPSKITKQSPIRPPRPDIELVSDILAQFKNAYEKRDMVALQQLSDMSESRSRFLQQLFRNYKEVRVSITNLSLSGQSASAVISITELTNLNGDMVSPGEGWREAKLVIRREGNRWGKILW